MFCDRDRDRACGLRGSLAVGIQEQTVHAVYLTLSVPTLQALVWKVRRH